MVDRSSIGGEIWSRLIEPACFLTVLARAGVLSAISGRLLRFVKALASSIVIVWMSNVCFGRRGERQRWGLQLLKLWMLFGLTSFLGDGGNGDAQRL